MASDEGDLVTIRDPGLTKLIKRRGKSTEKPAPGHLVYVHYVGTLEDGTVFDSSRTRGTPIQFNVGQSQVILGWDLGVATMSEGELAVLEIAPEYGYGNSGAPPVIPPNAKLTFEVELMHFCEDERKPLSNITVFLIVLFIAAGMAYWTGHLSLSGVKGF